MTNVVAIVNTLQKSGKTTTALNLGASIAASKANVLVIDGSLDDNFSQLSNLSDAGVVLDSKGHMALLSTSIEYLTVLSRAGLMLNDSRLADSNLGTLDRLKSQFEWVIFDTPSQSCDALRHILSFSDHIIVPIQQDPRTIESLPETLSKIVQVKQAKPNLDLLGFVTIQVNLPNTVTDTIRAQDTYSCIREGFPDLHFSTLIPHDVSISRGSSSSILLSESNPYSAATGAFRGFAEEIRSCLSSSSFPPQPTMNENREIDMAATVIDSSGLNDTPLEEVSVPLLSPPQHDQNSGEKGLFGVLRKLSQVFGNRK